MVADPLWVRSCWATVIAFAHRTVALCAMSRIFGRGPGLERVDYLPGRETISTQTKQTNQIYPANKQFKYILSIKFIIKNMIVYVNKDMIIT